MSNTGTFISVPDNQQGANPQLVTSNNPLPVSVSVSVPEYLMEVAKGNVEGHKIVHKFGHASIGTDITPISNSGTWKTPTSATSLEFVSTNVSDTAAGTGARKILVQGLDANYNEIVQEIDTNGTTAVNIPIALTRLYRWYVKESGTYADDLFPSYLGNLTIQESGGGDVWSTIDGAGIYAAQSEIALFSIPIDHKAYLMNKKIFVDTSKVASIFFIQRPFINVVTAPFTGTRRVISRDVGVTGHYSVDYESPQGPIVGPADVGFMGQVSQGTADISIEFETLVIKDGY